MLELKPETGREPGHLEGALESENSGVVGTVGDQMAWGRRGHQRKVSRSRGASGWDCQDGMGAVGV